MNHSIKRITIIKIASLLSLAIATTSCRASGAGAESAASTVARIQQKPEELFCGVSRAVCYSPFRAGQRPTADGSANPTDSEILEDLRILTRNGNFSLIRTYDAKANTEAILRLIRQHDLKLKVLVGAWLNAEIVNTNCAWLTTPHSPEELATNRAANAKEVANAIRLANEYPDIVMAVAVGNESLVDWNDHLVSVEGIIGHVRKVKQAIKQPVTVAENCHWWSQHGAALARELDFVSVHTYAQWEGKDIDEAMAYTIANLQDVRNALPHSRLAITEAGWATLASEFGPRASEEKQKQYYQDLHTWAERMNITTFFFETFDEDWKGDPGSPLGAEKHWGLFTVGRKAKLVMRDLYPDLLPTPRAPEVSPFYESKPTNLFFAKFNPRKAPVLGPLLLKEGDRLAIIGDSITEQKMYSRIIETYLTVCVPQLKITARQYGWGGETAEGFRKRMTNDCLRFQPTVATLCYGMNDHRYRPFDVVNGAWYRSNYTAIVQSLKAADARVVLGSPGCVSKVPSWKSPGLFSTDELNVNLCALRDLDVSIAEQEGVRFADVFWPMLKAGYEGQSRFATTNETFMIGGKDGVHPGWAGHLVMAYSFLRALGLDGEIGTVTVDMRTQKAEASAGHTVETMAKGEVFLTSSRYPFCAAGDTNRDDSIRSGMELVPFNQELNRFRLVVKNAASSAYEVTWGETSRRYSAAELAAGVNLAADFPVNPLTESFQRVDNAVVAKQTYETTQIKKIFHGEEGRRDMELAVKRTEAERAPLAEAVRSAFVPVQHAIRIQSAE